VSEGGGGSEAAPRSEEVGEGPSLTGRRREASNGPTVVLKGDVWAALKQGPGTLTHGIRATITSGNTRFDSVSIFK
jgi:hypothetical protein